MSTALARRAFTPPSRQPLRRVELRVGPLSFATDATDKEIVVALAVGALGALVLALTRRIRPAPRRQRRPQRRSRRHRGRSHTWC